MVRGSPWHNGRRGAVYVYDERDGEWIETRIDPPDKIPGGYFGAGLSVHGEMILIGSADANAVYELTRDDGDWVMDGFDLSERDQEEVDEVGDDLEPSGGWSPFGIDLLYVADSGSEGPNKDPGAVRILQEHASGWTEIDWYEGTDFGEGQAFGWDLALDGEVLVIPAPLHRVDGEMTGAAYIQGLPPPCGNYTPTILGTQDDDEVIGTRGDDLIFAGEGIDIIHVTNGQDVYCLNSGEYRFTRPVEFTRCGDEGSETLVTARPGLSGGWSSLGRPEPHLKRPAAHWIGVELQPTPVPGTQSGSYAVFGT